MLVGGEELGLGGEGLREADNNVAQLDIFMAWLTRAAFDAKAEPDGAAWQPQTAGLAQRTKRLTPYSLRPVFYRLLPDHETLILVDQTSPYALTGGIFSRDRRGVAEATHILRQAAGNFYINDKPTGAVVGQQPFGGARGSGTNDKAGSKMNLMRWVSARTIKETFAPATDWRYPFMSAE